MNLKRLQLLINGEEKPETPAEYALVKTYVKALSGEPLINICIDNKDVIDYYEREEYEHFIIGYAMGQKDFLDKLEGLDLTKIERDDDESIH